MGQQNILNTNFNILQCVTNMKQVIFAAVFFYTNKLMF